MGIKFIIVYANNYDIRFLQEKEKCIMLWLQFVAFINFLIKYVVPIATLILLLIICVDLGDIKKKINDKKDKE